MLPGFETLVREIRSKRGDLDWSQKELANRAGVSQSLVAKLEQEMSVPNYKSIRKIYQTLGRNLHSATETAGDLANPEIVSVKPDTTREEVGEIMKENDFSQLPVKEGNSFVGIVLSKDIGLVSDNQRVREVMRRNIPMIPASSSRTAAAELLETNNAVLVKEEGEIQGIITPADLL